MERTSKLIELIRQQVKREIPDEVRCRKIIIEYEFAFEHVDAAPHVEADDIESLPTSRVMLYYAMGMRPPVVGGCTWKQFEQFTHAVLDAQKNMWVYVREDEDVSKVESSSKGPATKTQSSKSTKGSATNGRELAAAKGQVTKLTNKRKEAEALLKAALSVAKERKEAAEKERNTTQVERLRLLQRKADVKVGESKDGFAKVEDKLKRAQAKLASMGGSTELPSTTSKSTKAKGKEEDEGGEEEEEEEEEEEDENDPFG
jgi:hypothetical protein